MNVPAAFTESMIRHNCEALMRAQGIAPTLAGLRAELARAVPDDSLGIRIELRTREHKWIPLDGEDPVRDAAVRVAPLSGLKQIVAVGLGMGYLLDALETAGSSARVLVIEPDPAVATLFLSRRDWTRWIDAGRLRMVVGPDYAGATSMAPWLDMTASPGITVSETLVRERPKSADAARAVAERVVGDANANAEARRRFAGRYLLQTLGNLPTILAESDVATLDGVFSGAPAVVVGAGPSLDDNIESLRLVHDRAVIIAADTTLRPLLAAGIRPHIVVGVDPAELNARHLAGVDGADGVWLVGEGSLHPSAFAPFCGRTFTFKVSAHDPWPWLQSRGIARGNLRAWGSVITSAFDLALRIGCNPIVFAGLDLAFTKERPYCRNTIFDAEWQAAKTAWNCSDDEVAFHHFNQRQTVWDTDLHGAPIRTSAHLLSFRNALLDQIGRIGDRRFVNATNGGMLYGQGVDQSTLIDALAAQPVLTDVRGRLAVAYQRGHTAQALLPADLLAIASGDSVAAQCTLERWRAFTLETVSSDDIVRAVRDAASRLPRTAA